MRNKFSNFFLSKYDNSSLEIQKKAGVFIVLLGLASVSGLAMLAYHYFTKQPYITFLPYIFALAWCIIVFIFFKFGLYYFASGFFVLMFIVFNFILMIIDSQEINVLTYRYSFIMTVIMILSSLIFHRKIQILFVSVIGVIGLIFLFMRKSYLPAKIFDFNVLFTFLINLFLFLSSGALGWFLLSVTQKMAKQADGVLGMAKSENEEAGKRAGILEVYTKPSLFKIISQGIDPLELKPAVKEAAVLFSGLNHFTKFLHEKDALTAVKFLNNYFETMNRVISSNYGEIDKLNGDSILALFDKTDNAVRSAIEMRKKIQFIFMKHEPFPEINCGIGINYGKFITANIGSKTKKDYTVIGEAVNTAVRFETLRSIYDADIIISEEVKNHLTYPYKIRFLDNVNLKGKSNSEKIYEIYDHKEDGHKEFIKKSADKMIKAYDLYTAGEFKSAAAIYENILKSAVHDNNLLKFYMNRCLALENKKINGALKEWQGIQRF